MATLAELLRQGADKLVNLPSEAQRFITNPQAFTQLVTGKNPLPRETGFAAGATGLPAQEMSVLDPNQAPYMQGYTQGEPIGYAGMAAPFAAPAAVSTAKALAPKAGMMAENYMVKQGMIQPLTAYHGTPHTIQGQFDINKVGTGEGAQAYGHGMYFAENPAVAKEYQKVLSGRTDLNQQPSDPAFIHAVESFREAGTPLSAIPTEMKKAYKSATDKDIQLAIQATEKGNLYKVDIPDADIPNMLQWDKPLSQQPNIMERLKGIDPKELDKLGINPDFTRRSTGKELTGESLYDVLTTHNSQKGASKFLANQGITGIRYLDQGSRPTTGGELVNISKTPDGYVSKIKIENRGGAGFSTPTQQFTSSKPYKTEAEAKAWADEKTGAGTSNFVVFDPKDVKILEQNNKPVTRKEILEQQINKIE
jgi:hypothetical protein